MGNIPCILKHIVAASVVSAGISGPLRGQDSGGQAATGLQTDSLLEELRQADENSWEAIEKRIWTAWSRSGSAAMDLLLKRGQDAIDAGDFAAAVEHLTALVDHAPDFAEAYDTRALAYYKLGRYGPALADIATTLRLNPHHFGAMSGLASILEETDRDREALEVYRRILEIHPHKPEAREGARRLEQKIEGTRL